MKKTSFREDLKRSFTLSAGWLFADLLLALAMLFLAANTIAIKPPPFPTPTAEAKPTALPSLELNPIILTLHIDHNGLLNNSQSAINDVKQQVRQQMSRYKTRRAGFVLAYGGAPTDNDIPTAIQVASKVENILKTFEQENFVFIKTVYHDPYHDLGVSSDLVTLEVYLFAQ